MPKKKKKAKAAPQPKEYQPKDFLDLITPPAIKFNTDHFICGGTYRCVMALQNYPATTESMALLQNLGEKMNVPMQIYTRHVSPAEEKAILHNASNKHRMERSQTNDFARSLTAEANLQDMADIITSKHRGNEPLLHCAVFLELVAEDLEKLRALRDSVASELVRCKLGAAPLLLRQQDGFRSSNPAGKNAFGDAFERVLPASSVANLYPMNYSGKTDPKGFYIGKDRFGANILVDLDRRSSDKTNPSVLVLGNSGQGKSYLLKLLMCNIRESGKSVICLDAEHEMADLSTKLNGCFVDLMSGEYRINPLEPKLWDSDSRSTSRLSQHISFLKDFFRSYRDFSDQQIDTIELMLERLYAKWEMNDSTDFSSLKSTDYPIFSDLYDVLEESYQNYDERNTLYTRESLRDILLGLHSMCRGSESRFFNGHTNIISDRFLIFGVKDLLSDSNQKVKDAMLFNILSYFNNKLLTEGNTMAVLDELHVWLSNPIAIEYIRNALKRARKRNSGLMLASQNLEDFMLPGVAEMTRPLFSIPTHQFIFNTGSVDKRFYMEHLQMEPSEYEHIQQPKQGQCFYKCGNDRHLLQVKAPEHKEALFGNGGGK